MACALYAAASGRSVSVTTHPPVGYVSKAQENCTRHADAVAQAVGSIPTALFAATKLESRIAVVLATLKLAQLRRMASLKDR